MLKKILEDGVCPEEILNNISEEDKQLIFLEIRREQLRKYKLWQQLDEKSQDFRQAANRKGKNVGFSDDDKLVSFLGEREGDKPVEELLREEAFRKAQQEAELQIPKEFEYSKDSVSSKIEDIKIDIVPPIVPVVKQSSITSESNLTVNTPDKPEKPIFKRTSKSAEQKRQDLVKRKSTELYQTYINHISELEESAKKENEELTKHWEKLNEQAKIDEEQRRKLAEEARKLLAHISITDSTVSPKTSNAQNPHGPPLPSKKSDHLRFVINSIQKSNLSKSVNDIKCWFLEHEWNKLRVYDGSSDQVPQWFHGIITREDSESLLINKGVGTFLIRLSDKFQCYVLSYKAKTKIKHILIESKLDSKFYKFFGPANVRSFQSLAELISCFQTRPISDSNSDILTDPCGQIPGQIADYTWLLQPDGSDSKSTSIVCSL